jgi:hypothetical protein
MTLKVMRRKGIAVRVQLQDVHKMSHVDVEHNKSFSVGSGLGQQKASNIKN